MELHPILESGDTPTAGMWYVLSPKGEPPSMRVGHTSTFIPGKDGQQGKLVLVGGANPNGAFGETHLLNLEFYEWDEPEWNGFRGRYEHSAFQPSSQTDKLYVFGGAEKECNVNDIQVLDIGKGEWSIVSASGKAPSARTCHGMASIEDQLFIFSGGQSGSEPVGDRKVHVFDAVTQSWSQPNVQGSSPKPRHGHVMVAIGNKIYVHGGMAGPTFYGDLHILDTVSMSWKQVKCKGDIPCNRAAHTGVTLNNRLYIFGGMNREGALDDMYVLDTGNCKWSKVAITGPPPPSRLDHTMCIIEMKASTREGSLPEPDTMQDLAIQNTESSAKETENKDGDCDAGERTQSNDADGESEPQGAVGGVAVGGGDAAEAAVSNDRTFQMILINGGMDTQGEIFDDTLVLYLQ